MTKKSKVVIAVLILLALLWWYFSRAKVAVEGLYVPSQDVGTPGASIPITEPPAAAEPWPWEAPQTQAQIDAGLAASAANPVAVADTTDYQGILDERTRQIQAAIAQAAADDAYVAAHPYIA